MRILVPTVLACVLVAACGDDDDTTTTDTTTPVPTTPTPSPTTPAPTFTEVYSIFSTRCVSCHFTPSGIGVSLGRLDMSSRAAAFTNLVNAQAKGSACAGSGMTLVVPGNADASLLHLKVAPGVPAPCGDKMPLAMPALPQAEVDVIRGWINAGASDN